MTASRAFLLLFAVALALRLFGVAYGPILPPTEHEAIGGPGAFVSAEDWGGGRLVSVVGSAVAAALLGGTFVVSGYAPAGLVAGVIAMISPLAITGSREAGPFGGAELLATLLIAISLRRPSRRVEQIVIALGIAVSVWILSESTGAHLLASPAVDRWSHLGWKRLGALLATTHHLGYVVVPLAVASLLQPVGRNLALLVLPCGLITWAVSDGMPQRLSDVGAFHPLLIAMASITIARPPRSLEMPTLVTPTPERIAPLLLVVLAVQSPILVSDLISGMRFPWKKTFTSSPLEAGLLDDGPGVIFTTAPTVVRQLIDRRTSVKPLPIDNDELAEIFAHPPNNAWIVLPIARGRAFGTSDVDCVDRVEGRLLPVSTLHARRFDLYRLSVRVYRLRGT